MGAYSHTPHIQFSGELSELTHPEEEPLFEPPFPNGPTRVKSLVLFFADNANPGDHLTYRRIRDGKVLSGRILHFASDGFSLTLYDQESRMKTPVPFSGVRSVLQLSADDSPLPDEANSYPNPPEEIPPQPSIISTVITSQFKEALTKLNGHTDIAITLRSGQTCLGTLVFRPRSCGGMVLNPRTESRLDFSIGEISSITVYGPLSTEKGAI